MNICSHMQDNDKKKHYIKRRHQILDRSKKKNSLQMEKKSMVCKHKYYKIEIEYKNSLNFSKM